MNFIIAQRKKRSKLKRARTANGNLQWSAESLKFDIKLIDQIYFNDAWNVLGDETQSRHLFASKTEATTSKVSTVINKNGY